MKKIHFILTGGTIDSYYDATKDTAVPREKSIVPKYLKFLNLDANIVQCTEICMKDSRQINEEDRNKMLSVIESSEESRIIITHGTYTIPDTARWLEAKLKRQDVTVIITGGMVPLEGFSPSDCPFNLGYSVSEVQHLPPGVYVCMNGATYKPQEVIKNLSTGKFISLYQHEWYK